MGDRGEGSGAGEGCEGVSSPCSLFQEVVSPFSLTRTVNGAADCLWGGASEQTPEKR